jgi:hypothetical protein
MVARPRLDDRVPGGPARPDQPDLPGQPGRPHVGPHGVERPLQPREPLWRLLEPRLVSVGVQERRCRRCQPGLIVRHARLGQLARLGVQRKVFELVHGDVERGLPVNRRAVPDRHV